MAEMVREVFGQPDGYSQTVPARQAQAPAPAAVQLKVESDEIASDVIPAAQTNQEQSSSPASGSAPAAAELALQAGVNPQPAGDGLTEPSEVDEASPAIKIGPNFKVLGRLDVLPQYLVSPVQTGTSDVVRMVTITLRASGDKTRDVLRLRRIHGTIMSYPGNDRFAFRVYERKHGYLVEFPNFTTGVCAELISKLKLLVGSENIQIEPITFQ